MGDVVLDVRLEHVSAGCNRVVNALHWGSTGLVAYGAHNAIIIYDPQASRVVSTVLGHTSAVNCVRWFSGVDDGQPLHPAPVSALASGSADGTVRIWSLHRGAAAAPPWQLAATLHGHSATVTSLTVHRTCAATSLLVSTGGNGDVCVWEGSHVGGAAALEAPPQEAWRLVQRLRFGTRLQHVSALAQLPGAPPGWLVLALGGVDGRVRLLTCPPGGEFAAACELEGHQGWIQGLDFTATADGRLLLASASQDKYIRMWTVAPAAATAASDDGSGTDTAPPPSVPSGPASLTRYAPQPKFYVGAAGGRVEYRAWLEGLLIGHEDWVHSVAWVPAGWRGDAQALPCLLSASMDRTMTLWAPDAATGLWLSRESVGDAGANHLGYFTAGWAPGGDAIMAHGFTGSLHMWKREEGGWVPQASASGHFGPVVDACWAADGACLLTASEDQTARITAQLHTGRWCELARPQVHGHDFSCVAALPGPPASIQPTDQASPDAAANQATTTSDSGNGDSSNGDSSDATSASLRLPPRYLYASGSEEKVLRVFEAPRTFHDTLAMARGQGALPCTTQNGATAPATPSHAHAHAAYGATLPALGLSNKAVYSQEEAAGGGADAVGPDGKPLLYDVGPDFAPTSLPSAVAGAPLEEHLAQNTFWPEIYKLYGHGNDVYCLAADPLGCYLASASRAQSAATAGIWLWDAANWTPAGTLDAHTLTVTQLAFSPNGQWLASAGRDRSVAVFARCEAGPAADSPPFQLVGKVKAHSRIVWSVDWSPDSQLLATASRDCSLKVWAAACSAGDSLPRTPLATLPLGDSVRSVAFAPLALPPAAAGRGARFLAAAGLEGGAVLILSMEYSSAGEGVECVEVWRSGPHQQHAAAVRRLCWRVQGSGGERQLQLASCGDDHAVRIFSMQCP